MLQDMSLVAVCSNTAKFNVLPCGSQCFRPKAAAKVYSSCALPKVRRRGNGNVRGVGAL
jgi:hypothetical protein